MTPGLRDSEGEEGHSESPALCSLLEGGSPETLKQLMLIWYFLVMHHYYKALWVAVTFSSVSPGKGQGDRRKSRGKGAVSDDTPHH